MVRYFTDRCVQTAAAIVLSLGLGLGGFTASWAEPGLPTRAEIISQILSRMKTFSNTDEQIDFYNRILREVDWSQSSPEIDLLFEAFKKTLGDVAYNSLGYIDGQITLAGIHIARGEQQIATGILKKVEHLAIAQQDLGPWEACQIYSCQSKPPDDIFREIGWLYRAIGDRKEAVRMALLELEALTSGMGQTGSRMSDFNVSSIIRLLIGLKEIEKAGEVQTWLVEHYLSDRQFDSYIQKSLIKSAVYIEHSQNREAMSVFNMAQLFFKDEVYVMNKTYMDGRLDLAWSLVFVRNSQKKGNLVLDSVKSELEAVRENFNREKSLEQLSQLYSYNRNFQRATEICDIYEAELGRQNRSRRQKKKVSLWTRPEHRNYSLDTLFDIRIRARDLAGAQRSFIKLKEDPHYTNEMQAIYGLAELNLKLGEINKAEDLAHQLKRLIEQDIKPDTDRFRGRAYEIRNLIELYLEFSDAYLKSGDLEKRDLYLSLAWHEIRHIEIHNWRRSDRVKILNRLDKTALYSQINNDSKFKSVLFEFGRASSVIWGQ